MDSKDCIPALVPLELWQHLTWGAMEGKIVPELMEHYERLKKVDVAKVSDGERPGEPATYFFPVS